MKTHAAAIQRSGRRGILVSVLIGLPVLLVLICCWSEPTQSAQAAVKMHLPKSGRNFNTRKAKAIRLPSTFSLDHPQREL